MKKGLVPLIVLCIIGYSVIIGNLLSLIRAVNHYLLDDSLSKISMVVVMLISLGLIVLLQVHFIKRLLLKQKQHQLTKG